MSAPISAAPKVMTLSREEMRSRALAFAKEWKKAQPREEADAKTFLDEFFAVFGRERKHIAAHEYRIKREGKSEGRIDLFWPGKFLVEMKSPGEDLEKARRQAFDYVANLKPVEIPRWVMVSDFRNFILFDLGEPSKGETRRLLADFVAKPDKLPQIAAQFTLADFPDKLRHFAFIRDEEQALFQSQPAVNMKAVRLLGELHDSLKASGYSGHALERFLVRILFCLFAEDTDIFAWNSFTRLIEATEDTGGDLGVTLAKLFDTLNKPAERRSANLPAQFSDFPYVNGGLFAESLDFADLNEAQRDALIACCRFDWARISPAVFGSLFQGVMDKAERREKGAHYTSEENIRKVIDPLFLDDLKAEFQKLRAGAAKTKALESFHQKLATLRFLDPACGCGNFLVIAYRELRSLELEVIKAIHGDQLALGLEIEHIAKVNVDQFYGIEIDEFPALIAETAMWLTDHQVNIAFSKAFGKHYLRIPLKKSATIHHGNALRTPWESVLPPDKCSFIMGNPPFVGSKYQTDEQRAQVAAVFAGAKGCGTLDFVAAWYRLAANYMGENKTVRTAFVSTNSVTQGEQVGILWPELHRRGIRIYFAHRTFKWANEAAGKAAVHCVIIGYGYGDPDKPRLFDYPAEKDKNPPGPHAVEVPVAQINPYLADAPFIALPNRTTPVCPVPEIGIGNKPIDGGHYLFTPTEKRDFLDLEPAAAPFFRKWLGSEEFINAGERHCLWLGDVSPAQLRTLPECLKRVDAVRRERLASSSAPTRKLATTPTRFHVENMPAGHSLLIPKVSSERREYIPIGFVGPEILCSDLVFMVPDATPYHFGIISSRMHMSWVRTVCGRLKSDYRYSAGIVYNNYPWPTPTDKARAAVEAAAEAVLAARAAHPTSSLADLYDPRSMPADLRKAHDALDRAVDAAYGYKGDTDDASRVAHLFRLYEQLTAPLAPAPKPAKTAKAPKSPKAKPAAR